MISTKQKQNKTKQTNTTNIIKHNLNGDESLVDCLKREDFQKRYLGRRGRRKGAFHLKRDLVSYGDLFSQSTNNQLSTFLLQKYT